MTETITLLGFAVSPHVRAARMALYEKGVSFTFQEIGLDHLPSESYGAINPFRKMPSLTHGPLKLFETPALLVYADAIGSGPALEPTDPAKRATMWKFIGIAQHYLYPVGAMQLYFQNVLAGLFGMDRNDDIAQKSVAPTAMHLDVLEEALHHGYLAGAELSLADLYCGAMVDYLARTTDGRSLVAARPKLAAWLNGLRQRESFVKTFPAMLEGTDQA